MLVLKDKMKPYDKVKVAEADPSEDIVKVVKTDLSDQSEDSVKVVETDPKKDIVKVVDTDLIDQSQNN